MPLVIDKEALIMVQTAYNKNAEEMKTLKGELESAISNLRGAGDSEEDNEFFKKFDNTLSKNMGLYVNAITHMAVNWKGIVDQTKGVDDALQNADDEIVKYFRGSYKGVAPSLEA